MKYFTKIEIKWGIIFFLTTILWMIFEKQMGWHDIKIDQHATMTNFFAVPAIAIYVFALLDKRRSLGNSMSWKDGFFSGLFITLIVVILSPIVQLLISNLISPDYFKNVIDYAVNVEKHNRAEMEAYFNVKSYIMQSMVGAALMGAVTSAIVSLILKRKINNNTIE